MQESKIKYLEYSIIGHKAGNRDRHFVINLQNRDELCCAICDGMGDKDNCELAAEVAIESLQISLKDIDLNSEMQI